MKSSEALIITGTVGSGKTTTLHHVSDILRAAAVPYAAVDLDAIRLFWPPPTDDEFGFELCLRNLGDLSRNFRDNGAERLVIAGVCENVEQRTRYAEAVGVPLAVCRLRVGSGELDRRLRGRHSADDAGLEWHLRRAPELDAVLDGAAVADVTVVVDDRGPSAVADLVLAAVGWTRP